MHADYDVNFAMQLHGTKHWKIAPNEHLRNVTGTVFGADRPQRDPAQVRFATSTPLPERMPDNCIEFTAGAGGLVFLPRDWWHETHATGDCLQLNVVVKGPTWLTVLGESLAEALVDDPEWRGMAHGVAADDERRDDAVRTFAGLLGGLRAQFAGSTDQEVAERLLAAASHRESR
jgi:ribosomal protein L16 Arg81 hydroxylase